MTLAMLCFLSTVIPAIENKFTSKQSFSAKHAGRVVSVLTVITYPVTEQESGFVLWFVMQYDVLNKTTHFFILVFLTDESLLSIYTDL